LHPFTPSFRGLLATAAGSIAGFAFFPPPATGSSNDRWRRSAVGLARLCLADQLATPLELNGVTAMWHVENAV